MASRPRGSGHRFDVPGLWAQGAIAARHAGPALARYHPCRRGPAAGVGPTLAPSTRHSGAAEPTDNPMSLLLTGIYTFGFLALGLFGVKATLLILGYLRARGAVDEPTAADQWPHVTVQVPIYNERYVAARVIDAV